MNKWDQLRFEIKDFNLKYEFEKETPRIYHDINSVIKDNQKFTTLANLASVGVYNLNRAIFTPKENARQKGSVDGRISAFADGNKLLKDSLIYEWSPEVLQRELSKRISKNLDLLKIAQDELDEKKPKKIYDEFFYLSKIKFLIYIWEMVFLSDERLNERYHKRENY